MIRRRPLTKWVAAEFRKDSTCLGRRDENGIRSCDLMRPHFSQFDALGTSLLGRCALKSIRNARLPLEFLQERESTSSLNPNPSMRKPYKTELAPDESRKPIPFKYPKARAV